MGSGFPSASYGAQTSGIVGLISVLPDEGLQVGTGRAPSRCRAVSSSKGTSPQTHAKGTNKGEGWGKEERIKFDEAHLSSPGPRAASLAPL